MPFAQTISNVEAYKPAPMVVAIDMGYGHLRAAHNIAASLGTEIIRMDIPPVAGPGEAALWSGMLGFYTLLSKACDSPVAGPTALALLEQLTEIVPLPPDHGIEAANLLSYLSDHLAGKLFGRRLRRMAARGRTQVVATYPAAAMAARHASSARVFCLATDTDLNRAWAVPNPKQAGIEYLAPVNRVVDRLRSFGVPEDSIHLTGFPLPQKLAAHAVSCMARRIIRLDPSCAFRRHAPEPIAGMMEQAAVQNVPGSIMLTLAIGGAGSQTRHVGQIMRSLRKRIIAGEVHLTLVAGTRSNVAETFRQVIQSIGIAPEREGVEILFSAEHSEYFRRFEDCLANTDILWTKPSELVFYAALGLPILLAPPIGGQEHANRDWLLSHNAALDAGDPSLLGDRLGRLLGDGELCRVAWNAYSRLDRSGLSRILKLLESG